MGWIVLFVALMVTNLLAIAKWPLSATSKLISKKGVSFGKPVNISGENELREILNSKKIVLIDFWAEWCGPCLLMNNSINEIARENSENVTVVKVDVSLSTTLSKQYSVRGLPTIIAFKNGQEAVRKSGSLTKVQLTKIIEQVKS